MSLKAEEKNKALVRRFLAAQANGDVDALEKMMAPDFVNRSINPPKGLTARTT